MNPVEECTSDPRPPLMEGDVKYLPTVDTRLGMWDMEQCDITRCTGRKLAKRSLLRVLSKKQKWPGVVLSPSGRSILSPADREIVETAGIAVVDCSWNCLHDVPFRNLKMGHPRLLPYLIAANSTHYGQPSELSCAEALAAGLYIVGRKEDAVTVLEPFRWGRAFFTLNGELMDRYALCRDAAEVSKVQAEYLAELQAEKEQRGTAEWDLQEDEDGNLLPPTNINRRSVPPPSYSSSSEEDEDDADDGGILRDSGTEEEGDDDDEDDGVNDDGRRRGGRGGGRGGRGGAPPRGGRGGGGRGGRGGRGRGKH
eukprot:PhM_4_TR8748/c0_g1_i1/m.41300/K09140/TSR3; pre-rRNA-processing protein TSR3